MVPWGATTFTIFQLCFRTCWNPYCLMLQKSNVAVYCDLDGFIKKNNNINTVNFSKWNWLNDVNWMKKKIDIAWSDLSVSSLQYWLFIPADRSFTPGSCRLLLPRSSYIRREDWELRTEDRASQLLSDRLQPLSLKSSGKGDKINKTNQSFIAFFLFFLSRNQWGAGRFCSFVLLPNNTHIH